MIRVLDRYIARSFLYSYLLSFLVMVGLRILIDLFLNLDEFAERDRVTDQSRPTLEVLSNIFSYYGNHLFIYFSQMSGIIVLVAAAFTVVRMNRSREMTAIMASGLSLYRAIAPIVIVGLGLNLLLLIDQEVIIPRVADRLVRDHDDAVGNEPFTVWHFTDRYNNVTTAHKYYPSEQKMEDVVILLRDDNLMVTGKIVAPSAIWDQQRGRWSLEDGMRVNRMEEGIGTFTREPTQLSTPIAFYDTDLTPSEIVLRQTSQWLNLMSTRSLGKLSRRSEFVGRQDLAAIRHQRFTRPIVNMLLLLLGLPFVLDREGHSIWVRGALCVGVTGLFVVTIFICEQLSYSQLSPIVAAWLPVMIFGPISVLALDGIKT